LRVPTEAPAKACIVACTDKRVSLTLLSFKLILLYTWLADGLLDTVQLLDKQNGPLPILLGEAWCVQPESVNIPST
jgi:hypothetical protein